MFAMDFASLFLSNNPRDRFLVLTKKYGLASLFLSNKPPVTDFASHISYGFHS